MTNDRGSPDRYIVISADGHASAWVKEYLEYFDPKYRGQADAEVEATEPTRVGWRADPAGVFCRNFGFVPDEMLEAFASCPALQSGGAPGARDPHQRLRDMDLDGIAGEVLFPDNYMETHPLFFFRGPASAARDVRTKGSGDGATRPGPESIELQYAGAHAYNRWLADFVATSPERWAGIAAVPAWHMDRAVQEIEWAAKAGLRGGVLLPAEAPGLPLLNDPYYEPLWAACEDLDMPLNWHGGDLVGDSGTGPDAFAIRRTEHYLQARRPLLFMMWGGVFERHPRLKLVFTEQEADWVPYVLEKMEYVYDTPFAGPLLRSTLPLRPREYWARHCLVGATFMSRREAEARYQIGVANIMWGSDYPHPEETFPRSREALRMSYAGLPRDEVRLMVGGNAVRLYKFDQEKLAQVAAGIGPSRRRDGPAAGGAPLRRQRWHPGLPIRPTWVALRR